jgi:hypothetical protein
MHCLQERHLNGKEKQGLKVKIWKKLLQDIET